MDRLDRRILELLQQDGSLTAAEIAERVAQHKALYEKNQAALNHITSMKEATAATAQLDQARRMIDEDERELGSGHARGAVTGSSAASRS